MPTASNPLPTPNRFPCTYGEIFRVRYRTGFRQQGKQGTLGIIPLGRHTEHTGRGYSSFLGKCRSLSSKESSVSLSKNTLTWYTVVPICLWNPSVTFTSFSTWFSFNILIQPPLAHRTFVCYNDFIVIPWQERMTVTDSSACCTPFYYFRNPFVLKEITPYQ